MKNVCDFEGIHELVTREHQVAFELYCTYVTYPDILMSLILTLIKKTLRLKICVVVFCTHVVVISQYDTQVILELCKKEL